MWWDGTSPSPHEGCRGPELTLPYPVVQPVACIGDRALQPSSVSPTASPNGLVRMRGALQRHCGRCVGEGAVWGCAAACSWPGCNGGRVIRRTEACGQIVGRSKLDPRRPDCTQLPLHLSLLKNVVAMATREAGDSGWRDSTRGCKLDGHHFPERQNVSRRAAPRLSSVPRSPTPQMPSRSPESTV